MMSEKIIEYIPANTVAQTQKDNTLNIVLGVLGVGFLAGLGYLAYREFSFSDFSKKAKQKVSTKTTGLDSDKNKTQTQTQTKSNYLTGKVTKNFNYQEFGKVPKYKEASLKRIANALQVIRDTFKKPLIIAKGYDEKNSSFSDALTVRIKTPRGITDKQFYETVHAFMDSRIIPQGALVYTTKGEFLISLDKSSKRISPKNAVTNNRYGKNKNDWINDVMHGSNTAGGNVWGSNSFYN